jgi:hypothetical protein
MPILSLPFARHSSLDASLAPPAKRAATHQGGPPAIRGGSTGRQVGPCKLFRIVDDLMRDE